MLNIHHRSRPTIAMSESPPHIALLPSAGVGHLTPFLRLAASLIHHNCTITIITTQPIVSLAESQIISRFLSTFPQVTQQLFRLLPMDPTTTNSNDPFFLQFEAIRRSAHLLHPIISSMSPPLSAFITDVSLISHVVPITTELSIPNYMLFTSSARILSFFFYYPDLIAARDSPITNNSIDRIEIPGFSPIPKSTIPPLLLDPTTLFSTIFLETGQNVRKPNGIFINTFQGLEAETLKALNNRRVVDRLPTVFDIGPFVPNEFDNVEGDGPFKWLDQQPAESVVYVSFGSRTAISRKQMRELGEGLIRSGHPFIWVVKDKKVDIEDESGLEDVVGSEFMEKVKDKGLVVKGWIDQVKILGHKSVGGFLSHCGWNSVTEAAWLGVPILAWPQHGDQKMNAQVVESSGLGVWVKSWDWPDEVTVVNGEEIGDKIKEMMESEALRTGAARVRDEAIKATSAGGSCETMFKELVGEWSASN